MATVVITITDGGEVNDSEVVDIKLESDPEIPLEDDMEGATLGQVVACRALMVIKSMFDDMDLMSVEGYVE